jgi:hypothetical protein
MLGTSEDWKETKLPYGVCEHFGWSLARNGFIQHSKKHAIPFWKYLGHSMDLIFADSPSEAYEANCPCTNEPDG